MRWHFKVLAIAIGVACFAQIAWGQSASVRYSKFYDHPNHGAGLFEDVALLNDTTIITVGPSLNFSNGYRDAHHIVVKTSGEVSSEAVVASQLGQTNTRAVLRSRYNPARVFVSGYFCDYSIGSPGPCDYYFSRVDPSTADTVFMRVYERTDTCDLLLGMVETLPNRILLLGYSCNDTVDGNRDVLLITVDTLGNEVNRVVYGGGGTDFVSDGVVVDGDGHVILVGYTKSFPSINGGRSWVLKTDSIGNVLWNRTYNGIGASTANGIRAAMLPDGNVIISGGKSGDGYLQKIDTEGNQMWIKLYDVPNGQGLWGVVGLEDGTIVSCGVTDNGNDQAGWLIKTDENGDTLWTRTYDPSDATDYLRNMLVMPNGDIVMVGFGRGENSTTQDGWILRVDSMGCEVENCFLTSVNEELLFGTALGAFTVYPNPANDVVNFSIQLPVGRSLEVTVTDMLGRQFPLLKGVSRNETGDSVINLNTSALPNGIYLLTITDHNGNSYTERLVVQH